MSALVQKYRNMVLVGLFFFYLGCVITLNFVNTECPASSTTGILESTVNTEVEYIVLVLSGPQNEVKRDAIRSTWANFVGNIITENNVRLYRWNHSWTEPKKAQSFAKILYPIGVQGLSENQLKKISNENSRSKDLILLENLHDSYENLARKVIESMIWLNNNYKNLKYVLKCDDDSFVRVDLIIKDLEAFAPQMNAPEISTYVTQKNVESFFYKGLYWGYFDGRARVFLNGKWEEKDWFLCDTYLPYALGGGYVISQSIVKYIARNHDLLSVYHSEDVSMGVWTAALDGINRVHDVRFDTEWKSRGCDTNMLVRHKQTPTDMFEMYRTLVYSHGKKLCKTENKLRKSYQYNWNVLPSMCCKQNQV
ncbi:beta-1,3-galactosyltransferase 6 [Aricia agestis]|uniref:beta-1,3-galactosyltransferase 6 n=1 Tax=Aricia agestis TaxID=91739 RepID=UPI001C207CFF|nr:beta-1,3-galactosyltransferase 6 [Aricia agestis]